GGTGKAHKVTESASVFRAEAHAGASGGDTGVAGAVAVSVGVLTHEAVVHKGATVTLGGGDLDIKAANTTDSITIATPRGAGGAGAIALGFDDTTAAVGGKIDAGGKATVVATHTLLSEATANASAKGAEDSKDDKSVAPVAFNGGAGAVDTNAETVTLGTVPL